MSKQELCRRTGFNKGYVYRLENDIVSPSMTTLEKYVHALGVSLSHIILLAEHLDKTDYSAVSAEKEMKTESEAAESPSELP